jgi:hypothetical protein
MPQYELLIEPGRQRVVWEGDTPEAAIARYADAHRVAGCDGCEHRIIAWRHHPRTGVFDIPDVRRLNIIE